MVNNISFITAHFYDFDWTELLLHNIRRFTPGDKICEIIVINQDRTDESYRRLISIDPKIKIVQYPKSEIHFQLMGHDHAEVLNKAVQEASGDYICIFDSDAHPLNSTWLSKCESIFEYFDAILALSPGNVLYTHPCFMFIRKVNEKLSISFDEELFTHTRDTGRLVGKQLVENGKRVFFVPSVKAFNGLYGFLYFNIVYHHQSASYVGSTDERLIAQIIWQNRFFKKFVINKRRYELTFPEYVSYKILKRINRYRYGKTGTRQ